MKEILTRAAENAQIGAIGFVRARIFSELTERLEGENTPMTPPAEERINPFLLMETAKTVIVCLFPFKKGVRTNISDYAKGDDYHITVRAGLETLCEILRGADFAAMALCDSSPLCERHLAYLAGLGFVGRNRALISPEFGSYVFIGTILTDAEIESDKPLATGCGGCNACVCACPGGALSAGFDAARCASYLTQKKGKLTAEERAIIKRSGYAWGCDICQRVCPHNARVAYDAGADFCLRADMAESNRDFRRKYVGRAFSWRGFEVIKRNLEILKSE